MNTLTQIKKKQVRFVVNPFSGVGSKKNFPEHVKHILNEKAFEYEIIFTEKPGHATDLSRKAVEQGIDIVVAVGGDGTINEVARSLIGTNTIMGLVPGGSGNGLARHLDIPMRIDGALKLINEGHVTKIDTGLVNDLPYVSIAGFGFDALVAKYFAEDPHRGFLNYFRIIAQKYHNYVPENYTIIIDEKETVQTNALFVVMANSNQFGYNTTIAPNAKLNDGLIDVCIAEKPTVFEMPVIINLLFLKMIHHSRHMHIYKAKQVRVLRQKEDMINLDGEPVKLGKELNFSINPLSLNIIIP